MTASLFQTTRVAPIMGRAMTEDDARATAPSVMVIGERLWRERYSADPSIVGKSFLLSDTPTKVVGVDARIRDPRAYRARREPRAANDGKLLPFWITPKLPLISIAYGVGLALCAARDRDPRPLGSQSCAWCSRSCERIDSAASGHARL